MSLRVSFIIASSVAALSLASCASTSQAKAPVPAVGATNTAKLSDYMSRVSVGMSDPDVRAALGEPSHVSVDGSGGQVWTYEFDENGQVVNVRTASSVLSGVALFVPGVIGGAMRTIGSIGSTIGGGSSQQDGQDRLQVVVTFAGDQVIDVAGEALN